MADTGPRTYFISFRIADDHGYTARYESLIETIRRVAYRSWWLETTAFIIFHSNESIASISNSVRDAIDPECDLAVIGMTDVKSMMVIGDNQDDEIYRLVPFAKKA